MVHGHALSAALCPTLLAHHPSGDLPFIDLDLLRANQVNQYGVSLSQLSQLLVLLLIGSIILPGLQLPKEFLISLGEELHFLCEGLKGRLQVPSFLNQVPDIYKAILVEDLVRGSSGLRGGLEIEVGFLKIKILFLIVSDLLFQEKVLFPQLHNGIEEIIHLSRHVFDGYFGAIG